MASRVALKTSGAALSLATLGWTIFLAGMIWVVAHPLQPLSLVLLFGEIVFALAALRLSEKSYRSQGGVVARLSYIFSVALFGAALFPFWVGLAFSCAR